MSDKELLNAAAKAAGITGNWRKLPGKPEQFVKLDYRPWDPLSRDGDALRLSVALGIDIRYLRDGEVIAVSAGGFVVRVEEGGSLQEATRRAIVGAAAQMGRGGGF